MPDTSKMTPETTRGGRLPMPCSRCGFIHPEIDKDCPMPFPTNQSASSEFKVGQTVWDKPSGKRVTLIHKHDGVWFYNEFDSGVHGIATANLFSATDPNQPAEPVPQKCPCACAAAAEEREACAKIADVWALELDGDSRRIQTGKRIAEQIRSRGPQ